MLNNCTLKYVKKTLKGVERTNILVSYPENEDGSKQEIVVPLDTDNSHYAEILKQVADGTITIAEAD